METAVKNTQVFYILMDSDVKTFFKTLLTKKNPKDKNAKIVENKINGEE